MRKTTQEMPTGRPPGRPSLRQTPPKLHRKSECRRRHSSSPPNRCSYRTQGGDAHSVYSHVFVSIKPCSYLLVLCFLSDVRSIRFTWRRFGAAPAKPCSADPPHHHIQLCWRRPAGSVGRTGAHPSSRHTGSVLQTHTVP